jgi:hypothetical protein
MSSSDSILGLIDGKSGQQKPRSVPKKAFRFIFHGLVATIGGMVIGSVLHVPLRLVLIGG